MTIILVVMMTVCTTRSYGQDNALDMERNSEAIVNVLSPTELQKFPDTNPVESLGHLPGIALLRTGGQATQLVIRGLNPEYNRITIAGVPIPANEGYRPSLRGGEEFGGGRGVDLRVIPAEALDSITVFKTFSPDMDGAFLGGTVDFAIRKARKSLQASPFGWANFPVVSLKAQGGYTDITNEYNNYKFALRLEKRYWDERLGIFAQGTIEQQNLTWDRMNADYVQSDQINSSDSLALTSLDLYFYPRTEKTYNGTITLDYEFPNGNLTLTNIFSQNKTDVTNYQQNYNFHKPYYNSRLRMSENSINYYIGHFKNKLNFLSNIFNYNQKTFGGDINATLSHSYSENISPDTWTIGFEQISTGIDQIDDRLQPVKIAELAYQKAIIDELELRRIATNDSFTKQRELRGSVDLSREFNLTDFLSLKVKTGGMYAYSNRSYDYNTGSGTIHFGEIGSRIVEAFPWLTTDYGIGPEHLLRLPLTPFWGPGVNSGTFGNGKYAFDNQINFNYLKTIKDIIVDFGKNLTIPPNHLDYWVDMFGNQASDYSGDEKRSAGFMMSTFDIGHSLSIMTGIRYQNLTTSNRANRFYNASGSNTYPLEPAHIDTTVTRSHGYWLPSVHLKFAPISWLRFQGAFTHTLSYPNYRAIIPVIDVYTTDSFVEWNDVSIKPAQSRNIDLQLSMYNNATGLFTFGGFLKQIDDFVLRQESYIGNPFAYEGLHDVPPHLFGQKELDVTGYTIGTYGNSLYQVDIRGIESAWQAHLWYLPGPLNRLSLRVNYTHIFSEAKYGTTDDQYSGVTDSQSVYNDTTWKDHLVNQPDDIVNLSVGYDYKDFSIQVTMNYQSEILSSTNFYNTLRRDKNDYMRWDLATRQRLPWYNLELFLNVNNLTGEHETFIMRGNGFPVSEQFYGVTAEAGFRVNFK